MSRRIAWLLLVWSSAHAQPLRSFDVILRHGTILDGTGSKPHRADVGVLRGRIAEIGDLAGASAPIELNAAGLYVAPGFINIHSHAVPAALPTAENMLTQGVTTEILNPDGGGSTDIAEQLSRSSAHGLAVNIGAYIGFNSVWAAVMGPSDRRSSDADIQRMQELIVRNLERGAWGVSAGLDYKPAYYARTEEVVRILAPAAPWRTNFPNHDRLTPETGYSSLAGMSETIEIGEKAGLVPVITHMKVQGHEQGHAPDIIRRMRQATASGHYTAADVYPYLAGQTSLSALIVPGWAQEGGRTQMLARFQDPELHPRIVREMEQAIQARFNGPAGVYLAGSKQELTAVMQQLQTSAGEAIIKTLEQGEQSPILRFGSEDDLIKILQNPVAAVACDCGAINTTPAHPRYFGTFPRVLGHYVRETKALTWEDAVRKMTGLPASTIGLVDRGFLATGMAADITVFDPVTVIDHATYEQPDHPSEGIRYVLVNGRVALRDGKVTGERGGAVLIRSRNMPSRPMNTGAKHHISVNARLADSNVRLDIRQDSNSAAARGSLRIEDSKSHTVIQGRRFGLIQVAGDWASITGRASLPSGEQRFYTVILDGASVSIDVESQHLTGSLDPRPVIQ
jgi:N-acyl-D-amino-acid deacylase